MNSINLSVPPLNSIEELTKNLTTPTETTIQAVAKLDGDCLILGVGGKMGPNLAELLIKAGVKNLIGVDLFPNPEVQSYLENIGVRCIQCDLLDEDAVARLPEVRNVFLLVGFKFGATGKEPFLWTMNAYLPAQLMARFKNSRVIYVSSGNVYKFTPVTGNGATETGEVDPIGEYAQSRLAGERLVQFQSLRHQTKTLIVRLFYSTELRYGIVLDVAQKIKSQIPIDLSMGHVNQIWQGDALNYLAQLFPLCASPAPVINLTGPEVLSVREIAKQLGELMAIEPVFTHSESATALLGDSTRLFSQFGQPATKPDQIIQWVAHWVLNDGLTLGKPTKYELRTGKF
jgi:nucleoside-diphosphate-sugar epimerase